MLDINTFLQSVKVGIDFAKEAASSEARQQLVDVLGSSQLVAFENLELRGSVKNLEEKLRFKGTLTSTPSGACCRTESSGRARSAST